MTTQTLLPGEPLSTTDYTLLASRQITPALASQALLRRLSSPEGAALVDKRDQGRYAGIVIPYMWPGESFVRDYRLRRDQPDQQIGANGQIKLRRRYVAPAGSRGLLYMVPGTAPHLLYDQSLPILFCEGEFQTMSMHAIATRNRPVNQPRFLPIGISGVWNWRGVTGKAYDARGNKIDVYGPLPDLDRLVWQNRKVWILFDTDSETDPQALAARRAFGKELERRGADVYEVMTNEAQSFRRQEAA